MRATIRLPGGIEATVTDAQQWQCADAPTRELLEAQFPPVDRGGDDPNPPLTLAGEAAEKLGGEITRFDDTECEEGKVY
jgi:hypothetical protein